ncbi:MAG: hypothetical protein AAF677_18700 [Pseudomonadota bacterium]
MALVVATAPAAAVGQPSDVDRVVDYAARVVREMEGRQIAPAERAQIRTRAACLLTWMADYAPVERETYLAALDDLHRWDPEDTTQRTLAENVKQALSAGAAVCGAAPDER